MVKIAEIVNAPEFFFPEVDEGVDAADPEFPEDFDVDVGDALVFVGV